MKTPEEIKKGLGRPVTVHYHNDPEPRLTPRVKVVLEQLHDAALAYILQLEQQNAELVRKTEQLERERDALENDLYSVVNDYVTPCFCCKIFDPSTTVCDHEGVDCFIWRGVQEQPEGGM